MFSTLGENPITETEDKESIVPATDGGKPLPLEVVEDLTRARYSRGPGLAN